MLPLIDKGLREKIPSSRTRIFSHIAPFDYLWATISPILAFLIRDGEIHQIGTVAIYCLAAAAVSLIVFQWFKISSSIPTFFSIHDAFAVTKACLTSVALTAGVLFVFTRLYDAPRSIPIIHFLVLGCGLVGARAISRLIAVRHRDDEPQTYNKEVENILIVGATRLALFFSKMLVEFAAHERRILAILDERRSLHNRTLNGYSIVGSPEELPKIIDEYSVHGVVINKVVIAEPSKGISDKTWTTIRDVCKAKNIPIEWLHERLLLSHANSRTTFDAAIPDRNLAVELAGWSNRKIKRLFDIGVSFAAMIIFAPLILFVAILVFIDVGFPLVFWQQRVGLHGKPLHVYKFRTLRSSFDRDGHPVPESDRLSRLGQLLRRNRLDEIPQLINIFSGGMSFVGPRPLLPVDQPKDMQFRLKVRPGLTGLAQVYGGKLLSPEEKNALDVSYVRHVSFWLDIKIMFRTLLVVILGDRRSEREIANALAEQSASLS